MGNNSIFQRAECCRCWEVAGQREGHREEREKLISFHPSPPLPAPGAMEAHALGSMHLPKLDPCAARRWR